MSFIASARKWRPQRFAELVGQEHIRRTLTNALAAGRVAPAYLFGGTRGVGKTTTARILAKALNCESAEGPVAEPCNECASCGEISRGAHPDILEIDGATYTGVDNVRELREGLRYRPARGRYKVVIIDEVHMLSRGAFNALLKTLEEPPPHVVFVLATTEPQKVPDTILSRCQTFEFRRLPLAAIQKQLGLIVQAQGREADEEAIRLIARMGEGSMRDAQSLLDQALAFSPGEPLSVRVAEEVLGVPSSEIYRKLTSAVVAHDAQAALLALNEVFEAGHDLKLFCAHLLEYLRDLMVIQSAGDAESLFDLGREELAERKKFADRFSFSEAHQAYSILQSAELELRTSEHPRITLEVAVLRMASVEPIADLGALIEQLEGPGGGGRGTAPPPPRKSPPAATRPPAGRDSGGTGSRPASAESRRPEGAPSAEAGGGARPGAAAPWNPVEARRIWNEAVATLRQSRQVILKGAKVDFSTEGMVALRPAAGNGQSQLREMISEVIPPLEEYLSHHAPWKTRVVLEAEEPEGGEAGTGDLNEGIRPPAQSSRRREEEAVIQEVVDLFNGQIVDIRPRRSRGENLQGDE